jgi:transposase
MNKQTQNLATSLRYCVGIDVSKDTLQVCVSVIDTNGNITIKGSSKVANKTTAFDSFLTWVGKHCKDKSLPIRYVMESTGVYHEQLAWCLFQNDLAVSVVLPNKAKHYLKSIGNKSKNDTIDARGLAQMGLDGTAHAANPKALGTPLEKYLSVANVNSSLSDTSRAKKSIRESTARYFTQSSD